MVDQIPKKKVHELSEHFKVYEIKYVHREQNFIVDLLSKLANTKRLGHTWTVIKETINAPIIEVDETNSLEIA